MDHAGDSRSRSGLSWLKLTPDRVAASPTGASDQKRALYVLDHLPAEPEHPLFLSYESWFTAVQTGMNRASASPRVGLREIEPGIWCGRRAHIAPNAVLRGPCWLGDHVRIGAESVIGPDAILEDRVVVDSAAEIRSSIIGPDTFVGALTRVEDSIAWGSTLIHWKSGSCTQVPDSFLLSALGHKYLVEPSTQNNVGLTAGLLTALGRPWEKLAGLRARLRHR
jgi:hypothetical protein